MSLPTIVDIDALADWLGEHIVDAPRADAILRGGTTRVRAFTGRVWLTANNELDTATPTITADDLDIARTVVLQMVARLWVNPKGIIQDTTGPFSARWSERVAEGLYLTDDEKAMLSRYRTTQRPALWTQPTTRGDVGACDDLVEYDGTCYIEVVGSELFPFLSADL